MNWERMMVSTSRGEFEVFAKGIGEPLCVTHLYSEFNETGDYFAEAFTETNRVYLVNLREAGNSEKAQHPYELSMLESVFDLEAIRTALGFGQWGFAGHSTGGMFAVVYGIHFSAHLRFLVITGAAAREYMTFSKDCIYNSEHPLFLRMQELIENLKSPDTAEQQKKEWKIERTKLSLSHPNNYEAYFSSPITKKLSAIRMNFFNRELQLFDLTRKLHLITTPSLIMCGRHDVQCPLLYSQEMAELIPGAQLAIFENSNHYPFLEEKPQFQQVYKGYIDGLT
ncbi:MULTISPECIES: alpha/beta fold hydrolase [unclassified Planococcus (in: firmicutes)]|uniref:alpha/beta fold hydrolase n=1 Tax=unclassified Planococcus (in: firmicutes) TaxID=2662419 RepID=UPI0020B21A85|nr:MULTISPECIES: alpha/beta hydrolase [unclassified Planococcus (in: firmicutes)]